MTFKLGDFVRVLKGKQAGRMGKVVWVSEGRVAVELGYGRGARRVVYAPRSVEHVHKPVRLED